MKKLSILAAGMIVAATLFSTTVANSQTTPVHAFILGLGIDTGLPTGDTHRAVHCLY